MGGDCLKRHYTVEEVAELCRVHEATVRRWIAQKHLMAIRLPGGYYRVPADEVDRRLRHPQGARRES